MKPTITHHQSKAHQFPELDDHAHLSQKQKLFMKNSAKKLFSMTKKDRPRIDYMPGPAAMQALQRAAITFPDVRQQALIDKLLITGLCALSWRLPELPRLYGSDRVAWQLPVELITVPKSVGE
jgi:hypothetical protein